LVDILKYAHRHTSEFRCTLITYFYVYAMFESHGYAVLLKEFGVVWWLWYA